MKKEIFGKENENKKGSLKEGLCALAAGFCCGLLGTGGGTVLLLFLGKNKTGEARKKLFATCSAVILPVSAFCAVLYGVSGKVCLQTDVFQALSALAGGALGALLLSKLPTRIIGKIFSAMLFLGGVLMLLFRKK